MAPRLLTVVALVCALYFACISTAASSDVVTLADATFDDQLAAAEYAIVEFYAPWCGHCKTLAPIYEEVATEIKSLGVDVIVAKLDATEEKEAAQKYSIQGFPTLKIFRNGEFVADYEGDRSKEGIVEYLVRLTSAPATELKSTSDVESFKAANELFVVGAFAADDGAKQAFVEVASKLKLKYAFGLIADESLFSAVGLSASGIVAFNPDFVSKEFTGDATSSSEIEKFVVGSLKFLVEEITGANARQILDRKVPLAVMFVDKDEKDVAAAHVNILKSIAPKFSEHFAVVFADGKMFARVVDAAGGDSKALPQFLIDDFHNQRRFPLKTELTEETVSAHLQKFVDGTLERFLKKKAAPTTQEGHVVEVVYDTYEEIVLDSSKDVLVEFFAPWCGHCQKLAPLYEELAERLKDVDTVVIAKYDGDANDKPDGVEFQGFPSLFWFPAGDKTNPVPYSGGRTVDEMMDFVLDNASAAAENDKEDL